MTDCPKSVKIATIKDENRIFNLLCELHKENGMLPMDIDKVRQLIRRGTKDKEGIIGIIDGPQEIEATIALVPCEFWYSKKKFLEEFFAFVSPKYRKSNHAKDLIQFGKHCAEQLKMPLLMGILSNQRTEAKIRLYQRHINQVGALFIHNLKEEDKYEVQ